MKRWLLGIGLVIGVATPTEAASAELPGKLFPPPGGGRAIFSMGAPGEGPRMMHGEGVGPLLPIILRNADLTPEQHEKIREIFVADRETLHQLFERLNQANEKLSANLFGAGKLTVEELEPQISEIGEVRRSLLEQGVKTTIAIRAVLTPEQLAKVDDLKKRIDRLQTEMRDLLGPRPD